MAQESSPAMIVPRPAATVMVVRDVPSPDGSSVMQVLMLRRNLASTWVGGAHLFPGGAVDEADGDAAVSARSVRDDRLASRALDLESGGLAYFVAAIRECFEEAGILLASRFDGSAIDFGDFATAARFVEHRRRLNAGELSFAAFCDTEDLRLETSRLASFSHWITPEGSPRRYDTRFFVAELPRGQQALQDDIEVIEAIWIEPSEAIARRKADEIDMLFPTEKNLEAIAGFRSSRALLEATEKAEVPTILPKITVSGADQGVRILLPGDPGYDEANGMGEDLAFPDRSDKTGPTAQESSS
jgi:8-oxo-dGTP pyrophosphatase MutT (NUDIX family)